jgi:secondary thiamine-phosphate synthase enzyme
VQITIQTTKKDEVIDITDDIEEILSKQDKTEGIINIFVQHTTCCITTADLDPGTDLDFLDALRGMLPDIAYRHPHDPSHAPDHLLSSIIGAEVTVPFHNGQLSLGVWQRVVLVELDGPRKRTIEVTIV